MTKIVSSDGTTRHRVSIEFDEDTHTKVTRIQQELDTSYSAIIRMAVKRFLETYQEGSENANQQTGHQ